ncbi:DEAD/DEAH box helicase family protein [Halarchaeum nitratireducens]|uniref:DNA 3'-5' helicase n=1 Tax=Halarchaeum nitratireducens TaxID=489913 RepID=A0A830GD66_9EURY|nr:superfamily II DNA or RNA helicase/intein/homing endonuclease [Halarchaeum solikamskense]GGN16603.1 hypothetical protein GCM10009021_16590 [Halarchaeum nitratireducens]
MTDDETDPTLSLDAFYDALESVGRPVVTAGRLAGVLGWTQAEASDALDRLADDDAAVQRVDVSNDPVVWFPTDWARTTERERVVVFPEHREVVVDQPTQFTRAQLAQFATLTDTTGENAYRYRVREEDVWGAPHGDVEALQRTLRQALGDRYPTLEEFVTDQWRRARQFRLYTHDEGYVVLEASSPEMMGNVAEQHLSEGTIRAPITDTEAWVAAEAVATVKRDLYEAGYPVQDDRTLDEGAAIDIDLRLSLRDYQRGWVKRFVESGSGVLVGPPGSGKTVAALGVMDDIGRETLILVPGRELVGQWRDSLLEYTTLTHDDVAEYHGGVKEIGPVTIATYSSAGMERHRRLFDEKRWGLVVYDEAHHIPGDVFRRTADLQASARLGLSVDGDTVVPVRSETGVEMRRIESLASEYLGDGVGVASVSDLETLAVTEDGAVEWTPLTSVMRHAHDGPLYRVRARNGREVTVTEDHSLIVFDGDEMAITSKLPGDLGDDDFLLQPSTLPDAVASAESTGDADTSTVDVMGLLDEGYVLVNEDAPTSAFDALYERDVGDNKARYRWKSRRYLPLDVAREIDFEREFVKGVYVHGRRTYVPPVVSTEAFARLAGLFVADGAIDDHRVEFYAEDSAQTSEVDAFRDVIRAVCPEADINSVANGENCTTLRVSGVLPRILEKIGLSNGAREKHVPPMVLSNPDAYEPFLEGVVLGDGHRATRERGREMVTISTSSDRLAQGLNLILAELGYVGGVYRRDCDVGVREGEHDTVTNNLVRFNSKNRQSGGRLSLTPFTETLSDAYEGLPRDPSRAADGGQLTSGLSDRVRLNDDELRTISARSGIDADWLAETDVAMLDVESVTEVDGEEYVYDVSTEHENFLGNHLFCHNSATPVRGDDREADIYTLIGPPIGTDWEALFEAGFVQEPEVEIRFVPWTDDEHRYEYASADGHERRMLAASNPAKIDEVRAILESHPDAKTLLFVDYLDQGEQLSDALSIPFVSGDTPHSHRERLFHEFRAGERDTLLVSRVADEGIDLPDAELAIVASGLGGSRRQGAQRAGRTMRPAGRALVYVLATRGTEEEDFARNQTRHLAEKGARVREADAEAHADANGGEHPRNGRTGSERDP